MNIKEVREIKKLFKDDNSAITNICGCYVNEESQKITSFKENFLMLPDEDRSKYFSIFKKALSGSLGKKLLNMEFPLETEMAYMKKSETAVEDNDSKNSNDGDSYNVSNGAGDNDSVNNGTEYVQSAIGYELLMRLRDSRLEDEDIISEFYDCVIANYRTNDKYLILLIYQNYDIPGKASDNIIMDDASEEVYSHVLCCICPVVLTKSGLSYCPEEECFKNRIRDWVVNMPELGFLFPAFNDRSTDIHSLLYYTTKPDVLSFAEEMLGCRIPISAGNQKKMFGSILEEALGEECDFDTVKNIHEIIKDKIEQSKEEPEPLAFDKEQVKQLLSEIGVEDYRIQSFDECYDQTAGENTPLQATNIIETRKFEIKSANVVVKVKPECADMVETRIMGGVPYLLIQMTEDVEVNGIQIKMPEEE